MSDWTSGYVADIGYTYGYYFELNPQRVKLAFLHAGVEPPEFGAACELGFGQGLSANMHAAASVCSWHGTDFNPSQAGFAHELATVSGANAHLFDESFAEFAARDLPDFDFIGLHGIWSWISDENRKVIVDFIHKKLKVGGVVYVSYNTLPGWSTFAPMRHLMTEHAKVMGAEGHGIVSRIDGALNFSDKLLAMNPLFAQANPLVADKFKDIKVKNRHYLAHEYFNRDWHPMYFATMANWMESAKLSYVCSAHYLDNVDVLNLTAEQQGMLREINDPTFKQTVRDYMLNQQFRKDYWVKGARPLSVLDQSEKLRAQRFLLTAYRPEVALKANGALGEANLSEAIYNPILDLMADHQIRTLAQIESVVQKANISYGQLIQAVVILCGCGTLSVVQDDAVISKAKPLTNKLNTHLMRKSRTDDEIVFLASPVTGGGMVVPKFHQLFLLAIEEGKKTPAEWAIFVDSNLKVIGQKILKNGTPVESDQQQLEELTKQANEFAIKQLPVLKAVQIA
jgi:hypothetical protein